MAIVTVTVPLGNLSIVNDPRDRSAGAVRMVTNFDVATDAKRALPYYDSEDGDSGAATSKKQNFCLALWLPGSTNAWRLFSLGVVSGGGLAEVLMKDITTGATNDLGGNGWLTPANNASSTGSTSFDLFVYYKRTGLIYGARAGTYIWAFDATTAGAWVDTHHALSYTNIGQGMVHSADDILYIPYDNKIAKNDNGTWTDAAFTIPSEYYISAICEYQNFLAIAASPLVGTNPTVSPGAASGFGTSRIFLWDRSATTPTAQANINAGTGSIQVLEELEGDLIAISSRPALSSTGKSKVIFRKYVGSPGMKKFKEFNVYGSTDFLKNAKQKLDNRLYFMMVKTLNGAVREGVWSVIKKEDGSLVVAHERTPNNDTALGAGLLKNFFVLNDYMLISYINSSSAYALSKTNDQASYTATSIIETVINPNMPPQYLNSVKKLLSVGATYDPLPAAGQVVAKARVDGAASYTTYFTETTDSVVRTEPATTPSGGTYINDGTELEFQVLSTGGAVPTALIYKFEAEATN